MKIFVLIVLIFSLSAPVFAQASPDSTLQKSDSTIILNNSLSHSSPSLMIETADSPHKKTYQEIISSALLQNKNLNITAKPQLLLNNERKPVKKEFLFYLLLIIILFIGIFKTFYASYFNNIFRVFFNTSLRQNQLTDIMLQARLPSLIFNFFFITTGGLYIWLLFNHYVLLAPGKREILILFCILALAIIYLGKFFAVKFIGWVSGMSQASDTYIFIIYLINKIIGIVLMPFLVLLAFAPDNWKDIIILLSYLVIGLFFLLRFFRSYGLLENKLSISTFHFVLYIIALEILPVFIVYKLMFGFLVKI